MVDVFKSAVIDAPVAAVWAVIRDFNGHDRWHPIVRDSHIEGGGPADRVGCVRSFHVQSGAHIREELTALSDQDFSFSYRILEAEVGLMNYVAHMKLIPVTEDNRTFLQWWSRFDTPPGEEESLKRMVEDEVYQAGIDAIRAAVR
jgi:hypothetical protein